VLQLLSETSELDMGRQLLIFLTSRPEISDSLRYRQHTGGAAAAPDFAAH
jgi:hypothetical protein